MRQQFIKIGVGISVFLTALFISSAILNRGTTDMTVDLSPATYPVISFLSGDELYNTTVGYAKERDVLLMKENITPLGENRSLAFEIRTYSRPIESISMQVRTKNGERLIEDTQIKQIEKNGDVWHVYTSLKDLLSKNEEYALTICLFVDGTPLYYNTRVEWKEEVDVQTFLAFAHEFTDDSFGEKEQYSELKKYLESSSSGDNSDFAHVDIHSSLEQVAWGNLDARRESDIETTLITAENNIASLNQYYLVQVGSGSKAEHYRVKEFFRLKKGTDRMHLLEYERSMSRLVFEEDEIFFGDTVYLGIGDEDVEMKESEKGGLIAFTHDGVLFVAEPKENRFARAFSYYDKDDYNKRPIMEIPKVKILSVSEDGLVNFAVYGYIPRGMHEGENGLTVYSFDFTRNTLEERAFLSYRGSSEMLCANLNNLLFLNDSAELVFFLDGGIHKVMLDGMEYETLAENLTPESFCVNEDGNCAAWITKKEEIGASEVRFMDFSDMQFADIKAGDGEVILPEGFMKEDLVYGIADKGDVSKDAFGNIFFPRYNVRIQNRSGTVYKDYAKEGVYVTDLAFTDRMVTLIRSRKNEDGSFSSIEDDTIVDNSADEETKNHLERVVTENYETVSQIALSSEFDTKKLQVMRPKINLYEGEREVAVKPSGEGKCFYSFSRGKITGVWAEAGDAVRQAYENNGFVLDERSEYIWQKTELPSKNQIMAIHEAGIPDGSSSLAVSLETMMQLEGFSQDADAPLANRSTPAEILKKYMVDTEVINLSGCQTEILYYYLGRDIPVLALTGEQGGILLIGYNSSEFVWMNPEKGTIYKVSKDETATYFSNRGNLFITYYRTKE